VDKWQKAAETLKDGGVVIIPSDSSYGIAALAQDKKAVEKLYEIKQRDSGKPSLIIVGSIEQAKKLVAFTPLAEELVTNHWPGGLTLVLRAINKDLSPLIYGENQTLAVRLPAKKELSDLANQVGPFILPSANFNGMKPPFSVAEVALDLIQLVDYFLDQPTDANQVSILIDARGEEPVILRVGAIKITELESKN